MKRGIRIYDRKLREKKGTYAPPRISLCLNYGFHPNEIRNMVVERACSVPLQVSSERKGTLLPDDEENMFYTKVVCEQD